MKNNSTVAKKFTLRARVQEEPLPLVIAFPLRGEWVAAVTPAARVPSHRTNLLGTRYAYDFVGVKRTSGFTGGAGTPKGLKFCGDSPLRSLVFGTRQQDCYGSGEPIYAPFKGTVITARDGWPDRKRIHLHLSSHVLFLQPAWSVFLGGAYRLWLRIKRPGDLRQIAGNYINLKMPGKEIYAHFAHARTGSIRVREGQEVDAGQPLAEVGHSGNSMVPHLHFHLMDNADSWRARGLACAFRRYEAYCRGAWETVEQGMPRRLEVVRYVA
jgi:hypothetical protein